MKALQITAWQRPPELVEVAVPEPEPGQVVVRVRAAGACHSDLHILEFPEGTSSWKLPFTLGHEIAGSVAAVGAGVDRWREGDDVVVYGPWGCGHCRRCRLGMENLCEHAADLDGAGAGLGLDGGMAEYVLVPSARLLVALPEGLDPVAAAPLTDAALTPYHAVKRALPSLVPGSTAVVVGVGGLGHMAIQLLRALSPATIVAVDASEEKLALAREVGADHLVHAGDDAAAQVRAHTGGRGAELVLDHVGADDTLALAAAVAAVRGTITVIGIALGTFPFSFISLPYECMIGSTYWGSAVELMEVLALGAQGRIAAHVERFPLDGALDAYDRMRAGTLRGRAVIVP
jgi:alcohol dehydrogenase, propanol-preferring